MTKKYFIFKKKSYFLGLQLEDSSAEQAEKDGLEQGYHFINCTDVTELLQAVEKIEKLVGVALNSKFHEVEHAKELLEKKKVYYCLDDGNDMDQKLSEIRNQLVPKRLPELVEYCAARVWSSVFRLKDTQFLKSDRVDPRYSHIVLCDMYSEGKVGHVNIYVDLEEFTKLLPDGHDQYDTLALVREYANQFLGIAAFNMSLLGANFRVGLPLSSGKDATIDARVHIPSALCVSADRIFQVQFGFLDIENYTQVDFGSLEFSTPKAEVEFF